MYEESKYFSKNYSFSSISSIDLSNAEKSLFSPFLALNIPRATISKTLVSFDNVLNKVWLSLFRMGQLSYF